MQADSCHYPLPTDSLLDDAGPTLDFRMRSTAPITLIAHRGASALLPEHTLAAYARAIDDGADFIEPDLVMTLDGVLVARHDRDLAASTDVASRPEFAALATAHHRDGASVPTWPCESLSFAQVQQLRATEPMPGLRGRAHDGMFPIPSFDEIVEFAEQASQRTGRLIGVIPEIKASTRLHACGLDPERALLQAFERHAWLRKAPFGIQSFEVGNLMRLHEATREYPNIFMAQLIGDLSHRPADRPDICYADMLSADGLAEIARYADVLAVHTPRVLPLDPVNGAPGAATSLVADAHAAGLKVYVWTLRPENCFLPPAWRCAGESSTRCEAGAQRELAALMDAGVDGVFADDPRLCRAFLDSGMNAVASA